MKVNPLNLKLLKLNIFPRFCQFPESKFEANRLCGSWVIQLKTVKNDQKKTSFYKVLYTGLESNTFHSHQYIRFIIRLIREHFYWYTAAGLLDSAPCIHRYLDKYSGFLHNTLALTNSFFVAPDVYVHWKKL